MPIDSDQQARATAWLETKGALGKCPACGKRKAWSFLDIIEAAPVVTSTGDAPPGRRADAPGGVRELRLHPAVRRRADGSGLTNDAGRGARSEITVR